MLRRKNLSPQLVAVLCNWWCCNSLDVRLGHVTSNRCFSVDREVPQGAPEESAGVRDGGGRNSGRFEAALGETTSCGTAMKGPSAVWDTLTMSWSKASLEAMIEDCCEKFGDARLEVCLDKTHWSSSVAMDGETLKSPAA